MAVTRIGVDVGGSRRSTDRRRRSFERRLGVNFCCIGGNEPTRLSTGGVV